MSVPAHVSGNANQINAVFLFPVSPYLSASFTKIHKIPFLVTPPIKNLQLEAPHTSPDGAPHKCESHVMPTRISANNNRDVCRNYVEAEKKLRKKCWCKCVLQGWPQTLDTSNCSVMDPVAYGGQSVQ